MGKDYYTKEEVARLLPSSYPVIMDMISKGELAEHYNGKERVIAAQIVNDFMLGRLTSPNSRERRKAAPKTPSGPLNWSKNLQLYPWQAEALNWWSEQGCHGVIEAVTGAGKTRVAIAAAEDQLRRGGCVVIIVPTKELLYQWRREVEKLLLATCGMKISIGLLGDGHRDTLRRSDVLLTTAHSARDRDLHLPNGKSGLIVADEVHRYGAEKWSKVLKPSFDRRLGLTATYEREDAGLEKFLAPYFGNMFSVDYRRALADGVIARFKIAFVAVRFSPDERKRYEESSEKAYKYKKRLVNDYGLPEEPFGEFMREATLLSKSGEEGARFAGFYLGAFPKRRQVLAGAKQKCERVADLTPAVRKADKSILFAQTKEAAKEAADRFSNFGINSAVLNSDMDMGERREVFAAFEDGDHDLVAAPRLLDEGVDVPAADLAIVLASSRSRRQMVQRMGRVVRKKKDGRLARLAVLHVEETSEDPKVAHEDFLYLVMDSAREVKYFGSDASANDICNYLNEWRP